MVGYVLTFTIEVRESPVYSVLFGLYNFSSGGARSRRSSRMSRPPEDADIHDSILLSD